MATWTTDTKHGVPIPEFSFLIDDTFEFLIDDTYEFLIQGLTPGTVWTTETKH